MNRIEVCPTPVLFETYSQSNQDRPIVVIIDIFRATTTISTALENGAKSVVAISDITDIAKYKEMGYLIAAERNVKQLELSDFGNSPLEFTKDRVENRDIAITTTNGTKAIDMAINSTNEILIGAFANINGVIEACTQKNRDIMLFCSGWNGKICKEDTLFAGAFIEKLLGCGKFFINSDFANISLELWKTAKFNLKKYLSHTEHYKRLLYNGLEKDIDFCLTQNTTNKVPIVVKIDEKLQIKTL